MKFAFSTVSCPKWDFETIAARAKEYGYQGVELRGFLNESLLTASNPFLTDPNKVRGIFNSAGIEIACLSSSIAFKNKKKLDAVSADELRKYIDTAAAIGSPLVKVFDTQVRAGQTRESAGIAMGGWLTPIADYAAEHDVQIVIENALSFRSAKEMWHIIDRLQHPAIACCWDVFNAALIGESPLISVPTLNSRIAYAQIKDAKFGTLGASYTKLGAGDVKCDQFITRLRGIGFKGYVGVEWEKAWLPGLAEPEEILPDAIKKLNEWLKLGVEEPPAPKAKAAHAAKGAAPAAKGAAPAATAAAAKP
jgi:sugar phosphate isomerase/epimerase